jgi:uncharacterized protein YjbI with pentapeptide repeats
VLAVREGEGGNTVNATELATILADHAAWLSGSGGKRADLHDANLHGADLSGADLRNANLSGANLSDTCLSSDLHAEQRAFCRACPPIGRHGGRIVYRTAQSKFVGNTCYLPGHTYVAPVLSFSCETACHPGIYAGSLEWMQNASGTLVRCYVRDGDWVITAKGAIRCKRLRVLSKVTA